MDKCTRPISMKAGIYLLCGRPARYVVGVWDVCEQCKPVADYYTKKYYELEGETNEDESRRGKVPGVSSKRQRKGRKNRSGK